MYMPVFWQSVTPPCLTCRHAATSHPRVAALGSEPSWAVSRSWATAYGHGEERTPVDCVFGDWGRTFDTGGTTHESGKNAGSLLTDRAEGRAYYELAESRGPRRARSRCGRCDRDDRRTAGVSEPAGRLWPGRGDRAIARGRRNRSGRGPEADSTDALAEWLSWFRVTLAPASASVTAIPDHEGIRTEWSSLRVSPSFSLWRFLRASARRDRRRSSASPGYRRRVRSCSSCSRLAAIRSAKKAAPRFSAGCPRGIFRSGTASCSA